MLLAGSVERELAVAVGVDPAEVVGRVDAVDADGLQPGLELGR